MSVSSLSPVCFESVSAVTATNSVELGTRRDHNGRTYVYVYNAGNSQASPGQGLTLSGVSGFSVTVSSTTMADIYMGVVYNTTFTTGTYGWALVRGFGYVKAPANSALVAGDLLGAGGDGVWAKRVSANTDTLLVSPLAKCTVATASAGVGEAYIRTLFG